MPLLSEALESDNFEQYNSLNLSSTNVQRLCSNFVGSESFVESSLSVILALCETNLKESNEFNNFYVKGYLPLIRKGFVTHILGLAVYVKEGVFLHRNCLWKTLSIPIFVFYFIHLSYFLFPYQLPFYSLQKVADAVSSNI